MHVTLISPFDEFFTGEVGGVIFGVSGLIVFVPILELIFGEPTRRLEFEIAICHGAFDAHVMVTHCFGSAFKGIEERFGFFVDPVVVVAQVSDGRFPFTVGGLMLHHKHEGFGFVAVFEPLQAEIGDDVSGVA